MTSQPNTQKIAVMAAEPAQKQRAAQLAARLGLPLIEDISQNLFSLLLICTNERLELHKTGEDKTGPVWVEFTNSTMKYRRQHGGGRKQALARAVGLKKGYNPLVLDATAGLGRDAFILAWLGCRVLLAERSPILVCLLEDGLNRAANDPTIGAVIRERLHLIPGDAGEIMINGKLSEKPDVVFLDPMHPSRKKKALVKKEMRLLRILVGKDEDAPNLLAVALTTAHRRVVVKRPRLAPAIAGPKPDFALSGKRGRYDVYLVI